MVIRIFVIIFILCLSSISIAQDFSSQIKKGKTLAINVIPVGDAYTNPDDEFTLKLKLANSIYNLELYKKDVLSRVILSEGQALKIITFFENWKVSRCRWGECGLTYSFVQINIGHKKKKFRDGVYYGHEIIDKYFNTANIN